MKDEIEIKQKLEMKKEFLEVIGTSNPNYDKIKGYIEGLEWALSKSNNKKEEKEPEKEEKKEKTPHLIDPNSLVGRWLNK